MKSITMSLSIAMSLAFGFGCAENNTPNDPSAKVVKKAVPTDIDGIYYSKLPNAELDGYGDEVLTILDKGNARLITIYNGAITEENHTYSVQDGRISVNLTQKQTTYDCF